MRAVIWPVLFCLVNACYGVSRGGPALQERRWDTYLGTAARSSTSRDALTADPQPVWRTDVGRGVAGSPALAEDVIAVAMVDRQVALLDRVTGAVLWRRRLSEHAGAGPILADDRLFLATRDERGRIHALRLTDGRNIWTRPGGDIVAPLLLADGALYAATLDGWVSSLSAEDGTRRWRVRLTGGVRASPVATPAGLIVATTADSMFLLDQANGRVTARRSTPGTIVGSPAMTAESLLVFGTTNGVIEVIEPGDLRTVAAARIAEPVAGHIAVRERSVWAVTGSGVVWSATLPGLLDQHTFATGLVSRAGPQPVNAGVYVASVSGDIALFDLTGRRRWGARLSSPLFEPPLVDGGTLLLAAQRGEVVAFR